MLLSTTTQKLVTAITASTAILLLVSNCRAENDEIKTDIKKGGKSLFNNKFNLINNRVNTITTENELLNVQYIT